MKIPRFEDYSCETNQVRVNVTPEFVPEKSDVASNIFTFNYTVLVENLSDSVIQLVNRHWKIYCDGKQFADVKGEGVIGEQPVLEPRQAFQYTSMATIESDAGSMEGSYTFHDLTKNIFFDAQIPKFDLLFIDEGKMQ